MTRASARARARARANVCVGDGRASVPYYDAARDDKILINRTNGIYMLGR